MTRARKAGEGQFVTGTARLLSRLETVVVDSDGGADVMFMSVIMIMTVIIDDHPAHGHDHDHYHSHDHDKRDQS